MATSSHFHKIHIICMINQSQGQIKLTLATFSHSHVINQWAYLLFKLPYFAVNIFFKPESQRFTSAPNSLQCHGHRLRSEFDKTVFCQLRSQKGCVFVSQWMDVTTKFSYGRRDIKTQGRVLIDGFYSGSCIQGTQSFRSMASKENKYCVSCNLWLNKGCLNCNLSWNFFTIRHNNNKYLRIYIPL